MDTLKIRSFRKTLRRFERLNQLVNNSCCPGISMAQCQVLLEIEEAGQATTIQLAKNMKLDKSTLSRTIEGLVKQNLVRRIPHPSDRRFTLLVLTERGKKMSEEINHDSDNFYLQVFQRIPQKMHDEIFKQFEILVEAINDYNQNRREDSDCCP